MRGALGQIISVRLPSRLPAGREQHGMRPCIVVADPSITGPCRFSVVVVVPLTTHRQQSWQSINATLYPILAAGTAGLMVDSIALVDHIQVTDVARVEAYLGRLTESEYAPILAALRALTSP